MSQKFITLSDDFYQPGSTWEKDLHDEILSTARSYQTDPDDEEEDTAESEVPSRRPLAF